MRRRIHAAVESIDDPIAVEYIGAMDKAGKVAKPRREGSKNGLEGKRPRCVEVSTEGLDDIQLPVPDIGAPCGG
jgi:hypothetical protein